LLQPNVLDDFGTLVGTRYPAKSSAGSGAPLQRYRWGAGRPALADEMSTVHMVTLKY